MFIGMILMVLGRTYIKPVPIIQITGVIIASAIAFTGKEVILMEDALMALVIILATVMLS